MTDAINIGGSGGPIGPIGPGPLLIATVPPKMSPNAGRHWISYGFLTPIPA